MRYLKNGTIALTVILIVTMAAATCVENLKGTEYVSEHVYGSWWFMLLWALLTIAGAVYIWRMKLYRRWTVFLLHASFVVILVGALTSHLTSKSGILHLREGESAASFAPKDGGEKDGGLGHDFGFSLSLDGFEMVCYPGTDAPMDYVSHIRTAEGEMQVSMNHIGRYRGYRFIQGGYDSDMQGTSLLVRYDPYGTAITYAGYFLLFFSIILLLFGNGSRMREFYRKASATLAVLLICTCAFAKEQPAAKPVDRGVSRDFGKLSVLYDGRICPVNTVASDFVTKLAGKASWNGISADEIFAGWTFNSSEWELQPMIRIKDKVAQKALGINGQWASYDDFWNKYNRYALEDALEKAYQEGDNAMIKHLRDADEKFNLIRMFYNGELLRLFPCSDSTGHYRWLAPGEKDASAVLSEKEWYFVRKSMDYLTQCFYLDDAENAGKIISKIGEFQQSHAAGIVPSKSESGLEILYNSLHAQRWPTMLYLTLSLMLAVLFSAGIWRRPCLAASLALSVLMILHLAALVGLRWIVSGHVPLSNGFETMQALALSVLIAVLLMHRKFKVVSGFVPLIASLALLVAMIGSGNPKITNLMPVLQSPLLSAHVMVIMISYALFALICVTGIQGVVKTARGNDAEAEALAALSHFLLYPAVFLLTIGVFLGAIWANVSWGSYWTWDPKEVWALITMLIYMLPLHGSFMRFFSSPKNFHWYCILAFASVLITYFGVNFILGGMHSYA